MLLGMIATLAMLEAILLLLELMAKLVEQSLLRIGLPGLSRLFLA
jgi:hypothetical protein